MRFFWLPLFCFITSLCCWGQHSGINLKEFSTPARKYYPETWFHFINGNIDKDGITRDLEAISKAGITGISFFHGAQGDKTDWPGTKQHIECLSQQWESMLAHTAQEAHRLGLRFSLQTCPGWATSGGPWITPQNSMRHLSATHINVTGGKSIDVQLKANNGNSDLDYRDIAVLAFPTPTGSSAPVAVKSVKATAHSEQILKLLQADDASGSPAQVSISASPKDKPFTIEITLPTAEALRTIELNNVCTFNYDHVANPHIHVRMYALTTDGEKQVLDSDIPRGNWQDWDYGLTLALNEVKSDKYRLEISNGYNMQLGRLRLYTAARMNNWEAEGAWTLRSLLRTSPLPSQDAKAYVNASKIIDISSFMQPDGRLRWNVPAGEWTILRIGHINTMQKNGPAPAEATGWEVNKLDASLVDFQFDKYIGRLASGPLNGLIDNMLMDSWECRSQTWTADMPQQFAATSGYNLTHWLPALFGYVLDSQEQTAEFLCDWRRTINRLFVNNFFGRMSERAHNSGMTVSYETAAGDIFPACPLEYYKWADVPMCEFWQPQNHFLFDHSFKPIRPTASAANMYGKTRVSAESFTSFDLTWNEHLSMLRDIANRNMIEGVTHCIFHTYTHNPDAEHYVPGTSFGAAIGTPFLRNQTWWPYMPVFTRYLARCSYMLESGRPVKNVLWYLGDEVVYRPDQENVLAQGYSFDYCNTDAFINRIDVKDGKWTTPEGITYDVLWLPSDAIRLLPATLERISELVKKGGVLVGEAPLHPATLSNNNNERLRFNNAVRAIWHGDTGRGRVITGKLATDALMSDLGIRPDLIGNDVLYLHRKTADTDWYMICPRTGKSFSGTVSLKAQGAFECWNPVSGKSTPISGTAHDGYTDIALNLQRGECVFIVVHKNDSPSKNGRAASVAKYATCSTDTLNDWTITFKKGWGIDKPVKTNVLKSWHELPLSPEGKAYSGTAAYTTSLHLAHKKKGDKYVLNLGKVEEIAVVTVNGITCDTLWTAPYTADVTPMLRKGKNKIKIDVVSTWRNRLIYDAALPKEQRKTWVIAGPDAHAPLVESGLIGPVMLHQEKPMQKSPIINQNIWSN